MLRGRRDRYHRLGFMIAFSVGAVAIPIQMGVGDSLARWVYNNQPSQVRRHRAGARRPRATCPRRCSATSTPTARSPAASRSPAWPRGCRTRPTAPSTVVQGLDTVPADDQPTVGEVNTVHLAWDVMVGLGTLLFLLSVWYWLCWIFRRDMPKSQLVPAHRLGRRRRRGGHHGGRLGGQRGRPPALDRLQPDEGRGRRHRQHRRVDHVRARDALYIGLGVTTILILRKMSRRFRERDVRRRRGAVRPERPGAASRARARGGDACHEHGVAVVLFVAVTAYAVFGGADFGAGFWDLVAGGAERGERPREVIDHSIGPVWEANHVWLIFCFVVLWTGFSEAYASITLTLFVPLTLAAFGIVLRGSSFAFRKTVFRTRDRRNFGAAFAALVGARAVLLRRGRRRHRLGPGAGRRRGRRPVDSWVNPTSVLGGVLAVVVVAYLAAVYLVWDARRLGDPAMAEYFRRRAIGAAVVAGVVAFVGIFVLRADARYLFDGLDLAGAAARDPVRRVRRRARSCCCCRDADRRRPRCSPSAPWPASWSAGAWPSGRTSCPTSLEVADAAAPSGTLDALLVATVAARAHRRPGLRPALRPRPEEPAPRGGRRLTPVVVAG